jgi:hypothetical protein
LPDDNVLTSEFQPDLLNGVQVIRGKARTLAYDAAGAIEKSDLTLTAIPYYAWANRGRGEMTVWIARDEQHVKPAPFPTLAIKSKVTTSGRKPPTAINDGETSFAFDWWPRKGTTEWVEYEFPQSSTVSEAEVYWFDDTGHGEVRVPAGWRILYRAGSEWKPVETESTFAVDKDRFNKVTFRPVTTNALRLEVTLQPQWSAGIHEWKVK